MRTRVSIAVLAGILSAGAATAQTYSELVVLQPAVEIRSGPSEKFYPTSKMLRNDRVTVLRESKEAPGWLEIKPPTGSFSWIRTVFLHHIKPNLPNLERWFAQFAARPGFAEFIAPPMS